MSSKESDLSQFGGIFNLRRVQDKDKRNSTLSLQQHQPSLSPPHVQTAHFLFIGRLLSLSASPRILLYFCLILSGIGFGALCEHARLNFCIWNRLEAMLALRWMWHQCQSLYSSRKSTEDSRIAYLHCKKWWEKNVLHPIHPIYGIKSIFARSELAFKSN